MDFDTLHKKHIDNPTTYEVNIINYVQLYTLILQLITIWEFLAYYIDTNVVSGSQTIHRLLSGCVCVCVCVCVFSCKCTCTHTGKLSGG